MGAVSISSKSVIIKNNDLDSPHPLSIMSAIYPITGIDCIAVSSHSMYLNLYILIIIREWRVGSKIYGLGAGQRGRVVDARLIVVASGVGDVLMSLTRAESRC